MKIILNQNIDNLGNEGDIVNVKDCISRNKTVYHVKHYVYT